MNRPESPLIALATGGTGGHVFPARALAEAMLEHKWRVVLFVDRRGGTYLDGLPSHVRVQTVPSATHARHGLWGAMTMPFKILVGVLASTLTMLRDRPAVLVGFGGYTSFPPVLAGWLLRIPSLLHEQNARMGLANRVLVRLTRRLATTTEGLAVPRGVITYRTGNPVRREIRCCAARVYTPPASAGNRILVMAGSQGAALFDAVVPEALMRLDARLRRGLVLAQQLHDSAGEDLAVRYRTLDIDADLRPFFADIPDRLATCQIVIARAGASSLAEICCIGRPAILVPFARSAGNHQVANARCLEAAGAAICIEEHESVPERLATALTAILDDPVQASRMAAAARSLAVADAAAALARTSLAVAEGE